ncbi:MAG: aldose 1-epimerase family protein [Planctomycetaceae bacterium]|nr:aldose 1-epimerase family protein [Planctomycetaceae bacterium]
MAKQSWKIIDVDQNVYLDSLQVDASQVTGAPGTFKIRKWTHRGGLSAGIDEIRINNGQFEFSVLPTRGMGLWKAWWNSDFELGWQAPTRGPVHPSFVPLMEPSGLGWLDGFDELLCRCGAESNGAPDFDEQGRLAYPLHGRMANLPAQQVDVSVDGDQIVIRGVVNENRFHFAKLQLTTTIKTRFGQPGLEIHDEVRNLSASETTMQMLYHTNFGSPLLEAGAELILPAEVVVPRNEWAAEGVGHWSTYSEPKAGMPERVYFFKMHADSKGDTQALLRNSNASRGVSLHWNTKQLPCFTQWKNETSIQDGYVTGLEPGTNFPNPRGFEESEGRVVKLPGGGSHQMKLGLAVHPDASSVRQAEAAIAKIQADRQPKLYQTPQSGWCDMS